MVALVIPTDAPAVPGPPQGHWTYADWEALPDHTKRYEIIDGVLYMTTAPSSFHQWIVARLWQYIGVPALDQGLAYVFDAPIGVIMPGCDPVQPDYVVVLAGRASIIRDKRIFGVPDILVEVLSPGNTPYDQDVKLRAYARAGVPEYVIIDPRTRTLSHYRLDGEDGFAAPTLYGPETDMSFDCLPGISVRVGDLFADAPDTTL